MEDREDIRILVSHVLTVFLTVMVLLASIGVIFVALDLRITNSENIIVTQQENRETVDITRTEIRSDFTRLYEQNKNGVVVVYMRNNGRIVSQGAGFFYVDDYIVTARHITESPGDVKVKYGSGMTSDANIVGSDPRTDITVLRPTTMPKQYSTLEVDIADLQRGNWVMAFGSPGRLEKAIITGIVSSTQLTIEQEGFEVPGHIKVDGQFEEGYSGGPVITLDNNVIGMAKSIDTNTNQGFIVSGKVINEVVPSIIENNDYAHVDDGLSVTEIRQKTSEDTTRKSGLVIDSADGHNDAVFNTLESNSVSRADIITEVDGQKVRNKNDYLMYLLLNKEPGDKLEYTIRNGNSVRTVTITLEEL